MSRVEITYLPPIQEGVMSHSESKPLGIESTKLIPSFDMGKRSADMAQRLMVDFTVPPHSQVRRSEF